MGTIILGLIICLLCWIGDKFKHDPIADIKKRSVQQYWDKYGDKRK